MLPVLFTIPAAAMKVVAIGILLFLVVSRAIAFRAQMKAQGKPVGIGEALLDDKWTIAVLVAVLVVLWRAGFLDQDLPLHSYGVMLMGGFLVAIHLAQREARRQGLEWERVGDLAFYVLVAALLGSRIYFILVNWDDYFGAETWLTTTRFGRIPRVLSIFEGGLVFYGGFIGATAVSFWYMRKHGMGFLRYADVLIPSVAIGHFFGRIGCFAAGCCWGEVAHGHWPWLARFGPASLAYQSFAERPNKAELLTPDNATTLPLHPTQLYESVGELALFILLVTWIRPHKRFHGQVLASWLMLYAVLRWVVESFRGDTERGVVLGLGVGQWTSIVIFAIGLAIWLLRRPRAKAAGAAPAAA
jgi:phosphatidylglycerol:prolipoprotein diacylglycerol transferase